MTEDVKIEDKVPEKAIGAEGKPNDNDEISVLKKNLEDATKRLDEEKTARERAEQEREEARKVARTSEEQGAKAVTSAVRAQEESISSAVSLASTGFEAAQREFEDAYDSGDKIAIRNAQIKLNDAQANLRGAEFNKKQFETWKTSREKPRDDGNQGGAREGAGGGVTVKTATGAPITVTRPQADWLNREFPDFSRDAEVEDAIYDSNRKAMRRGVTVDSPEYFAFMKEQTNKALGRGNSEVAPTKKEEKKQSQSYSSAAAPVGGTSGAGSSSSAAGSDEFHMTSEHREAAAICYPDLYRADPRKAEEKYAKAQIEIRKQKGK